MKREKRLFKFGRNVFVTGVVSFCMDFSSEMIYPLVPLFLANVLGVNKSVIGLIEGIAESTASLLRVFSGWISDRIGNRKWLMAAGYGISTLSRPVIATSSGWHQILAARFIDRFGKGIRVAPRDALIVESTEREYFGRAFGLQRAMDTFGAVAGPATAFFLLSLFSNNYRTVFWISIIPAAVAVLMIIFFISEPRKPQADPRKKLNPSLKSFDWKFWSFLVIMTIFAVGNSSDVFLILRAQNAGIPAVMIPIVYLFYNLIYSLSSLPAGMAADRFGKKRVVFAGFLLFSLVYFGFAVSASTKAIWVLFGLYGLFMGMTEGIQKAFLATIIPEDFKATAFGIYNTAVGLALFPASLVGGWLWDHVSPSATFYYGAATAFLSAILFFIYSMVVRRDAANPSDRK